MKEAIYIENLGPLKKIELSEITPFTVFVGDSGSGKSTILKVLVLFRWLYKKICIRSYLKNAGITKSPFRFNFKRLITNNGFSGFFTKTTKIVYIRGNYRITYQDGSLNTDITIANKDISLDKLSFISDKRNVIPELLNNNVSISNSFYLNETWLDFKKASENFSELAIPYLDIKLIRKKTQNGYRFFIEGADSSNYQINFENSSSGMQNVAPLLVIMNYFVNDYNLVESFNRAIISVLSESDLLSKFKPEIDVGKVNYKNLFFHIEEPELSLYPHSQLELVEQMFSLCLKGKNSVKVGCMLTTHSPYIINYLNLLIKNKTIKYTDVNVYEVIAGTIRRLNIDSDNLINTAVLSEPISNIYRKFNEL